MRTKESKIVFHCLGKILVIRNMGHHGNDVTRHRRSIGIFDFFKIAKDLNTSDLKFALDILEPLYMAAFVFWIIAFYLSRISLGIERMLGLGSEPGGERT